MRQYAVKYRNELMPGSVVPNKDFCKKVIMGTMENLRKYDIQTEQSDYQIVPVEVREVIE